MPSMPRKKIWELWDFQCPVLGTCLSMSELRKLGRKVRMSFPCAPSDFHLHTAFVQECRVESGVSRVVNKFLDKKYAGVLQKLSRLEDPADLRAAWRTAVSSGDIPGTFWAVLTHPAADEPLVADVYGEVHMLSHLVGAANRADIRRLARLEKLVETLRESLARTRNAWRLKQREAASELQRAAEEKAGLRRTVLELQSELRSREQVHSRGGATALLEEVAALGEQVSRAEAETAAVHARMQVQAKAQDRLIRENARLLREIAMRERVLEVLDQALGDSGGQPGDALAGRDAFRPGFGNAPDESEACLGACAADGACPCGEIPELCGKSVLYVGGRSNLVPHYRQVIEGLGCRFRHHDGGVECCLSMLEAELGRADVVVCPVDCVSHEACLRVKRFCKSAAKPFFMLRSSGLSTLTRSIHSLAAQAMQGNEGMPWRGADAPAAAAQHGAGRPWKQ
jgi:hypothetical protein